MSKQLSAWMIGLAAVALVAGCNRSESPRTQSQNDSAVVAGKNTPPATPSPNSAVTPANPTGPTTEPGAAPAPGTSAGATNSGSTTADDRYSAELRKCDSLPASDRAHCVEQAKKQHGQM